MSDDKKIKLLGTILTIICIIICLIIIIYLVNYIFNFNKYKYDLPFENTTTRYDYMYQEFNDNQKIEYNDTFNNLNFIIPLNNAIKDSMQYKESNLLALEVNKFKYIFTSIYLENKIGQYSLEVINEKSLEVFRVSIFKENIQEYLINDVYSYLVDETLPDYCIKTKKALKEGNKINILVDSITRTEEECKSDDLNYSTNSILNEFKITYELNNEKNYLNSVVITK